MKQIIIIVILSLFYANCVLASEIFGRISTNPKALSATSSSLDNGQAVDKTVSNDKLKGVNKYNNAAAMLYLKKSNPVKVPEKLAVKVLGIVHYPDGSLLRGPDHKIFLIQGQAKKYIVNLIKLKKYFGRKIVEAASEELASYQTQAHLDNELIRKRNDVKVFVIKAGKKKHILNLDELRKYYFGQEIFNIDKTEMALY